MERKLGRVVGVSAVSGEEADTVRFACYGAATAAPASHKARGAVLR